MTILAMTGWQTILSVVLIAVCLLLMLVILIQRGRGGGLAGAFGGSGGSSAFGAKTGDVFTWVTVGLVVVFLCLTVVGNYIFDESGATPTTPSGTASTTDDGVDGVDGEYGVDDVDETPVDAGDTGDAETSSTPDLGGADAPSESLDPGSDDTSPADPGGGG